MTMPSHTPDSAQLPHLLCLVDDPSEVVQAAIADAFEAWGEHLDDALNSLESPPDDAVRSAIRALILDQATRRFLDTMAGWAEIPDDDLRLEAGLAAVAAFIAGPQEGACLTPLLDEVADDYRSQEPPHDPLALAHYLFKVRELAGERDDYYAPRNSNLVHVLESGTGIPISLACIYLLIGRRMDYDVFGCNWPGHFLALARAEGEVFVVDGFNAGQTIPLEIFLNMQGPSRTAAEPILLDPASPESILIRVLGNVANAYDESGDAHRHRAARQLQEAVATRFSAAS